jgi:hypothetical protein
VLLIGILLAAGAVCQLFPLFRRSAH